MYLCCPTFPFYFGLQSPLTSVAGCLFGHSRILSSHLSALECRRQRDSTIIHWFIIWPTRRHARLLPQHQSLRRTQRSKLTFTGRRSSPVRPSMPLLRHLIRLHTSPSHLRHFHLLTIRRMGPMVAQPPLSTVVKVWYLDSDYGSNVRIFRKSGHSRREVHSML
jgi:hypothetical protein